MIVICCHKIVIINIYFLLWKKLLWQYFQTVMEGLSTTGDTTTVNNYHIFCSRQKITVVVDHFCCSAFSWRIQELKMTRSRLNFRIKIESKQKDVSLLYRVSIELCVNLSGISFQFLQLSCRRFQNEEFDIKYIIFYLSIEELMTSWI